AWIAASCAPTSSILRLRRCANVDADSSADWAMTIELGACAWYSASHGGHVEPSSRTTTDSSVSSDCSITSLRVADIRAPRASVTQSRKPWADRPYLYVWEFFRFESQMRFEQIVSQTYQDRRCLQFFGFVNPEHSSPTTRSNDPRFSGEVGSRHRVSRDGCV